jgi:hypothetical protein
MTRLSEMPASPSTSGVNICVRRAVDARLVQTPVIPSGRRKSEHSPQAHKPGFCWRLPESATQVHVRRAGRLRLTWSGRRSPLGITAKLLGHPAVAEPPNGRHAVALPRGWCFVVIRFGKRTTGT